jgi:hypothetical protein
MEAFRRAADLIQHSGRRAGQAPPDFIAVQQRLE